MPDMGDSRKRHRSSDSTRGIAIRDSFVFPGIPCRILLSAAALSVAQVEAAPDTSPIYPCFVSRVPDTQTCGRLESCRHHLLCGQEHAIRLHAGVQQRKPATMYTFCWRWETLHADRTARTGG